MTVCVCIGSSDCVTVCVCIGSSDCVCVHREERVKNYARKSGKSDPVDVMGYLREEKNNFRPRM